MLCDLAAFAFVALALAAAGRPPALAVLYGWNPLVVKVFAGSGHVDALAVAALAAMLYGVLRGARTAAAAAFAAAVLAKLSPLILLPLIIRRVGWRWSAAALAMVALGYLPFGNAGWRLFEGLITFARQWQFNAGPFLLVRGAVGAVAAEPDAAARAACALAIAAIALWQARREEGSPVAFARRGAATMGALIVLSPAVMPWYVAWVLPFAVLAGTRAWIGFSALVCLAFLVMVDMQEHATVLAVEYGLAGWLLWREFVGRPAWAYRRATGESAAFRGAMGALR